MIDQIITYIVNTHLEEGANISKDTELISSGLIDSINTLKLVDFIEETFDIELEAYEVNRDNLNTPSLIEALILRKKEKVV
ncbi:MAG: acyl carrier protein [Saprospiraceae bacterium]|nr:acyl carrier protein [Bacteroidia bacterium]NNE15065.1 acyl carrier protein [Saprospiraceae bacterium]NNL90990.1 acyl carrier protein [Saprospiraceae bacterium]